MSDNNKSFLHYIIDSTNNIVDHIALYKPHGKIVSVHGNIIRAVLPFSSIGEMCMIINSNGTKLPAEVIGVSAECTMLSPIGTLRYMSSDSVIIPISAVQNVNVGDALLGRVINGLGQPIDGKGKIMTKETAPLYCEAPDPLQRKMIDKAFPLGVRAIDGILTFGRGQRIGVFATAGGGKTTLLSSIARGCVSDVNVIALIGERGREVKEFIQHSLKDVMHKSVIVCSTSDKPSTEVARSAYVATAISEYFRSRGLDVLLMMDSVTRFARAKRDVGLASGEPPTRRGFTPSVFDSLPKLMERVGNDDKGSISAIYTVLMESEMEDPVGEEVRSILDGHVILSRDLALANHYPAIDILASKSRVMDLVASKQHLQAANKLRALYAKYVEFELMIQLGEYQKGNDKELDEAVSKISAIKNFLIQDNHHVSNFEDTVNQLYAAVA